MFRSARVLSGSGDQVHCGSVGSGCETMVLTRMKLEFFIQVLRSGSRWKEGDGSDPGSGPGNPADPPLGPQNLEPVLLTF